VSTPVITKLMTHYIVLAEADDGHFGNVLVTIVDRRSTAIIIIEN